MSPEAKGFDILDWSDDDQKLLVESKTDGTLSTVALPHLADDVVKDLEIAWSSTPLVPQCLCSAWWARSGPYAVRNDFGSQVVAHYTWNGKLIWSRRLAKDGQYVDHVMERDGKTFMIVGASTGTYGTLWRLALARLHGDGSFHVIAPNIRAATIVDEDQLVPRNL